MPLVLLIGGARSGKSALALSMAQREQSVVFVATAEPGDDEMADRIERHRGERPPEWTTIEEPVELGRALAAADPAACVVVDCLTLWVANALDRLGAERTEATAIAEAARAAARPGLTIAITNEVGLGIVPDNPLARTYRDLLGRVNAAWADEAERSYLVVAGKVVPLEPAP
jgi:adenosyl cobinamide kinase/adenosyl cobinamide phosphate guanylyltransferase